MPLGKGKYKVSAYLSDEELELLESLCQTWHCNKSQAVIRAIKTLASDPSNPHKSSNPDKSYFNPSNPIGVTFDELERYIEPIKNQVDDLDKAMATLQNELTKFDKAFNSLGSTVHDHDQMLSQPIATKDELHKAIATLTTEIEDLKKF